MSAKSEKCTCEFNLTCGYCMGLCAERNLADRNNAPELWYVMACNQSEPKSQKTLKKEFLDSLESLGIFKA